MAAESRACRGTVLVVDDEPGIQAMCRRALEERGYEVATAGTAAAALLNLDGARFDAVVLDLKLPDRDGLDMLRAIRQRRADTVVVLITGFASLDTAMEAVRLGAYEYLRKPFHVQELARVVERGIEGHRVREHDDALLIELRRANDELLAQQRELRERMRLAGDDVSAFVELGRQLSEGSDALGILRAILRAGATVTRARAAAAYRVEPEVELVRGLVGLGVSEQEATGSFVIGQGLIGRVAARGIAQMENDLLAGAIADDHHLRSLGVTSALAAPLVRGEDVLGVIAFFDQEGDGFSEASMNLARVLAAQAARVMAAMPSGMAEIADTADGRDGEFVDLSDLL